MKLRTRLILLFLVVSLLPLGLAIALLMDWTHEHFEAQIDERATRVSQQVEARFRAASTSLRKKLNPVSVLNSIDRLKAHVKHEKGPVDEEVKEAVRASLEEHIASPSLDTLAVMRIEPQVQVVASAHQVGIPIPDPAAATRARAEDSRPFFRQEEIDEGGTVTTYWTLQTQRMLSADLVVVGGQKVDRMLEELRVGLSTKDVHLVFEIDGKPILGESGPPSGSEGFEKRVIPIQSISEQGASGQILLFMSRSSVVEAQQSLLEQGFALAGLALVLALVLGFWLSGRLSKPLEDLAQAAGQVASGRRDLVVKERRGRDELAGLIRSFNIMTETLEDSEKRLKQSERVAAWQEIAKRIAHEIKNPLTPIQLNIELLQRSYRREPERYDQHMGELLSATLHEVGRVGRIVNEFSNFARMPAPNRRSTCLGELVASTVLMHQQSAGQGILLECTGLSSLEANIDPDQLTQVVTNLVKNAIEAVKELKNQVTPGRVTVHLDTEAGQGASTFAVLTVTDNGVGLPEEVREKLFTPYFTTKTGGTGLGLAIVHRIVVEHGGSIEVLAGPNEGTSFRLQLPLV